VEKARIFWSGRAREKIEKVQEKDIKNEKAFNVKEKVVERVRCRVKKRGKK